MKDDCWLTRTSKDGNSSDSAVHFWSPGEERWISSSLFPPTNVEEFDFALRSDSIEGLDRSLVNSHSLSPKTLTKFFDQINQKIFPISIHYKVDYAATTRGLSRWVIAKHPFRMTSKSYRQLKPTPQKTSIPLVELTINNFINLPLWSSDFGDRSTGDLLLFTSPQLSQPLRIAGSPILRFSLNLTAEFDRRVKALHHEIFDRSSSSLKVNRLSPAAALDVIVFGYLEDIDNSTGDVHYVTEGRVLLSHRPTISESHINASLTGLDDWNGCIEPPYNDNIRGEDKHGLRQTSRIGSADVIYQSGDQQKHHFSAGMVCVLISNE